MKKLLVILVLLCVVAIFWADTLEVPEDYDSIQSAIGAAEDGDEIIVSPGTYYENIDFDGKVITLASLFYTTQDSSYISQTIIDGSDNGSVVTFNNDEGSGSILTGFTITNGYSDICGGGIYIGEYCSPTLTHLRIINNQAEWDGGGFYFEGYSSSVINHLLVSGNSAYYGAGGAYRYYCDLVMEDSEITGNVSSSSGGGIYANETTIEFHNIVVVNNIAEYGGGFCFDGWEGSNILNNVFISQNQATDSGGGIRTSEELYLQNVTITENVTEGMGGGIYCYWAEISFAEDLEERCDIYSNFCVQGYSNDIYSSSPISMKLNTFSVQYPTSYYAAPVSNFTFDIINGLIPQIDGDIYVSANGSNENSGLSEDQALQTIRQACSLIASSEENPHSIYLAAGTYRASETGEIFPIRLPDNVTLSGVNRESVILDAEGNSSVMEFYNVNNITVSGLTISNGNAEYGGGIVGGQSHIELTDLIIRGNHASHDGGGIYLYYQGSVLRDLLIYGNTAGEEGGGIHGRYNSFSVLQNVTVWGNSAGTQGGGLYTYYSQPKIINSIFSNNEPNAIYCGSYNGELSLAYCDIEGGTNEIITYMGQPGLLAGMIYDAPQFIDAENGDFQLSENSPCIDMGTAFFEHDGQVWIDLQENEYWGEAPDMGAYEYLSINFGDVDDNGLVESYDASLVLMNVVGIDAIEEDPLPWEEWRRLRADVDLDGEIGAVDGAYILQHVVGIIGELPVYNGYRGLGNSLTLTNDEKYLYLSSEEEVIGLSYNILQANNVILGRAEVSGENCLHNQNGSQFAMASAEGTSGEILRIAYERGESSQSFVHIEVSCNGNREVRDYYFTGKIPSGGRLCNIYPNPFNPETTIAFNLREACDVELGIYNLKGQLVKMLVSDEMTAGEQFVNWDGRCGLSGRRAGSGIYLVRLQAGNDISMRKIVMVK